MKMVKKLLTILFVVISLFAVASFAACGEPENTNPVNPTPDGDDDNGNTNTYYPVLEVYSSTTQIAKGQSIQIEPVLSYGGNEVAGTFTYTSSDDTVVSVDETGKATGLKVGTATVKVSCTYNGVSLEKTVQIKVLSFYTFGFVEESISVGTAESDKTATVEYYLYDDDVAVENPEITWTIADESVATVNNGVVTGVNYGETTLTATFNDISIEIPVKCYVSTLEGEINSFCHYSRNDSLKAAVITTGVEIPYELVSTAVAGKTPTHNNFLKITVTKDDTYPGLYLSPMISKQDLLDLQEQYDVNVVEFSMYLEKVSSTQTSRIPRSSWNGHKHFGFTVDFDKWTTISISLQDIIDNYDKFASQEEALFYVPNTDKDNPGDALLVPSIFNIYVDAVMAKVPVRTMIRTVDDFWNINNDLSGYYVLANDIDFNNVPHIGIGSSFGQDWAEASQKFTGTFDGNGYALKNLKTFPANVASYDVTDNNPFNQSVFANVAGTIKNVAVDITLDCRNTNVRQSGFIGTAHSTAVVENCYVKINTSSLSYNQYGVALIARSYGATVKNCVSVIDVTSGTENRSNYGAIIGCAESDTKSNIKNSYGVLLQNGTLPLQLVCNHSNANASKVNVDDNSACVASLAELYTAISADGVLAKANGWNTKVWSIENNTLKFGTTTIYSAE